MADEEVENPIEDKTSTDKNGKDEKPDKYLIEPETEPIVTEHSIKLGSGKLDYTAKAGMLALRNELGEIEAGIYHTSYTVKSDKPRPVTFTFNGGPGSSSVWLHLGAVGPKRVKLGDEGMAPPPPYELVDNLETWLEFTDLVFIDPVGTGFSRSVKKKDETKFWGLKGDVESVGTFIREYLSLHDRWTSPVYIAGESYGTTRAAGLSDFLFEYGVALNGIVLVSSILNFQTARFTTGNDLPYILFFPTYAATAWFHKRVSPAYQKMSLADFLDEVERFVEKEYAPALQAGDALEASKRASIAKKTAAYLGISQQYVELANLRIQIHHYCKELLRDERKTVGRLDSRYKGIDGSHVGESIEHDPSSSAISAAFTAGMNDYVRRELGYRPKLMYNIFAPGDLWRSWDWGKEARHPDTSEALRAAMSKNPFMKVFVANGYYDLATPYYATRYTVGHMGLEPEVSKGISMGFYEAGHMMYVREADLAKLKADVKAFYASTNPSTSRSQPSR